MITILFHMKIRPDQEAEFQEVALEAQRATRADDDGCISYTFLRQASEPGEYVLFEQWRDRDALIAHAGHLVRLYGPPRQGDILPARLMEMFERSEAVHYEALA